jgi:PTS system ascorbate-specific IIA component
MSVGVLLVTHGRLGQMLLDTVTDMMGSLPLPAEVLEVHRVQDPDVLVRQGLRVIERMDPGGGVVILTDAFGSTPSNIATRLGAAPRTQVLAGVNLPMLVRIFNYPKLDLDAMARNALEGGQRGVVVCPRPQTPAT